MTVVIHCLETWKHYLIGTWFTVVIDNVANTFFKTQKKFTTKQARWQEFLGSRHNQVADAYSRKEVASYMGSLNQVVTDFTGQDKKLISGFPKVESFGLVLVVVDMFSKYVVFIPALSKCPAKEARQIFFSNVVKHFGILEDIVSDQDTWFTCRLSVELFKMWGTECKFSMANHPQTNDQTE